MSEIRPTVPGIERSFANVPTQGTTNIDALMYAKERCKLG